MANYTNGHLEHIPIRPVSSVVVNYLPYVIINFKVKLFKIMNYNS